MFTYIKYLFVVAIAISAFPVYANHIQPSACNTSPFTEAKSAIIKLNQSFNWNSSDCEIIATKSEFPKQNKLGEWHFADGLQVFVYENKVLKYICLPGWSCKAW